MIPCEMLQNIVKGRLKVSPEEGKALVQMLTENLHSVDNIYGKGFDRLYEKMNVLLNLKGTKNVIRNYLNGMEGEPKIIRVSIQIQIKVTIPIPKPNCLIPKLLI